MPKIDYPNVIEEDIEELKKLEKRHRYSHLFHRVRMLRLLKSGECANLSEAAEALGYSWRQCQRWFAAYRRGGKRELLVSRVDERGPKELITEEAWQELQEAMKRGEIATVAQAYEFLVDRGVGYSHPESVGGLLRRRKAKLKTGRRGVLGTRRPTNGSKRLSKKVLGKGRGAQPGGALRQEAAEGPGLRRGAFRADQLAQKTLLPEGVSPALRRQARL